MLDLIFTAIAWLIGLSLALWLGVILLTPFYFAAVVRGKRRKGKHRE